MPALTRAAAHVLAVLFVVVAPWLGRRRYARAQASLTTDPFVKTRVYQRVVRNQPLSATAVLTFWWASGLPAARFGLGAPRSWWLTAGATVLLTGLLVRTALRLRPRAAEVRERLKERAEVTIPDSPTDRRWFAAMSFGSGLAEELAYRGFLFYYVGTLVPVLNGIEDRARRPRSVSAWRTPIGAGAACSRLTVAGLIMAALYLARAATCSCRWSRTASATAARS